MAPSPVVLYVVRPGERNEELRYSLRSLGNLAHERVVIVGHRPSWVVGVDHIPAPHGPNRYRNVRDHLRRACRELNRFVLFNDDFFVLQTVTSFPAAHRGTIASMGAHRKRTLEWWRRMAYTARLCERAGVTDPLCYELHLPMEIDGEAMGTFLDEAPSEPLLVRSLYGNLSGLGGEEIADVKIFADGIPTGPFCSTSDASFKARPVGRWLREQFPDPSPYER